LNDRNAYREDHVNVKTNVFGMVRRLWPHFMRHKVLFFASMAAVLAVAAAGRLSVTLFGYAIDQGILNHDRSVIVWVAIAYFTLEAGRCFMTFLQTYLFEKVGNRILFEIRDQVIRHVQRLPIAFFDKNPTGRIVTRVTNDVISLGEVFTEGLISVFASLVSLLAITAAMMAISVKMTLATLIIAPPLIYNVARLTQKIMVVLRESKTKLAAINAFVAENINGMRVLQLYGRIDRNLKRFHVLSADYRAQQLKSVRLYALLWPTVSFFNAASVGTALYFGGRFVMSGEISTGAMVAFILHVRAFIDPLNQILEKYQNLQNSLSGAERIFTLLDERTEDFGQVADETSVASRVARYRGEVEFQKVSFQYESDLPFALNEIDLQVSPGQSVALVGRTGSGKSTMIALLQRFYDPTIGHILIDGKSISEIPRRLLRSRIGVVQQDTFLFRGTIADNISLGDASITRERIERAADLACLSEVIAKRPGALDAKVEERGANLSIGERQLIAFARILAFDPDILILDEATANIDSKTESLIQEATQRVRRGRTSFIIAHRISTIQDCDKIVVLDRARIQEMGTHAELLLRKGIYYALCRAQQKTRASQEPVKTLPC
jgi:ATP-binding cassette subfamily B multidrug efflux pump